MLDAIFRYIQRKRAISEATVRLITDQDRRSHEENGIRASQELGKRTEGAFGDSKTGFKLLWYQY